MLRSIGLRAILLLSFCLFLIPANAKSVEITVMCSGGFFSALKELAPVYEKKTGNKLVLVYGPSMGTIPTAIPMRIKNGEKADIVIMAGSEVDKLITEGLVVSGSRVDIVKSKIGICVKAGAPKPDISSTSALIKTLRSAKSIGYSGSASGRYLVEELFPRLGIWDELKSKSTKVVKDGVAAWVARGDLEIGFQQVSEMISVQGVDFVGVIPDDVQKITIFSSGVAAGSKNLSEGKSLVHFLLSAAARPVIMKQGLEPFKK